MIWPSLSAIEWSLQLTNASAYNFPHLSERRVLLVCSILGLANLTEGRRKVQTIPAAYYHNSSFTYLVFLDILEGVVRCEISTDSMLALVMFQRPG